MCSLCLPKTKKIRKTNHKERVGQMEKANHTLQRKIGSTLYKVNIYFKNTNLETLEEKILRLIKNDLNFTEKNAKIKLLQAGWLSEGSSE